jgi:transposase
VVLCVDQKRQIQALDRSQPIVPMLAGTPARATHDDKRNGTSSLFAALDTASGKVIGSLHSRHRAIEFKKFLQTIDRDVPAELDVHLILDNSSTHKTPQIKRWLAAHPRFVLHFTPTGTSWVNLVEQTNHWVNTRDPIEGPEPVEPHVLLAGHSAERLARVLHRDVAHDGDLLGGQRRARPAQHLLDAVRRVAAVAAGDEVGGDDVVDRERLEPGTAMRTPSAVRTIS